MAGKGGTGKTSVAAALSIYLSKSGYDVIAIDTDSVPNLAQSLGIPYRKAEEIVPLINKDDLIAERTGVKPGVNWGAMFKLNPKVDDIADKYGIKINNKLKLIVVGSISASKQGCLCPAVALARRFLRYSLKREKSYVIVDSEAGAEIFGRGLAENFDIMLTLCEPTVKSIKIGLDMIGMSKELNINKAMLIINKVSALNSVAKLLEEYVSNDVESFILRYDPELMDLEYRGLGINYLSEHSVFYRDIKELACKYLI